MSDYLKELNERQREAVTHIDGPLMIVAGAGSGKTKVLTTRIAHLMRNGVDAFNILALTFTNKAAAEMKERIEKILGNNEARNLYIGTFHSVFARIMRAEATKMGYPSNFTIYDSDDAKSLLKGIINENNLDDKMYKPQYVAGRISAAKNNLMTPAQYQQDHFIQQEDARSGRPLIGQLYAQYAARCFKNGAMDFDDLLFKMYQLLVNFPDVLAKYQHKFKYVLIDEYQDTNIAQYQIVKLLAAVHENICVVGDDAQSIYSFRGATIENILKFQKDYEGAKVVKLEQNYRSSQNILNVANRVIGLNKNQIPKNLWTDKPEGEKLKLVRTLTDNDEGKFVADAIAEQKLRNHYNNRDFAILYRTNAQSRAFEESLRRMNIAYRIFGGLSFYQRKEIKDFIAYLRIVANPQDEEALKRIINYPVRGIGKTSVERIIIAANESGKTFWEVLQEPQLAGMKGAAAAAIEAFVVMMRSFQAMQQKNNAYDVAFAVGKHTNMVKELYNDKTVEGLARYENVQELLNSIKEYTETPNEDGEVVEDKSLGAYLQQITLLTDADKNNEEDQDVVKLMTIHAAKGLEFDCVFAVGLEENIFPSAMSLYDREDLEEERRLFYVVITRARDRLWISYANSRYRFGSLVQNDPSRFIDEVPPEYMDRSFAGIAGAKGSGSAASSPGGAARSYAPKQQPAKNTTTVAASGNTDLSRIAALNKAKAAQPVAHVPSANFVASDPEQMEQGMRVEHMKFGVGTIIKMDGGAHNRIATIDFGAGVGEKKIMLNYAKLMILN
ncbi:ATP-dependent helicase [Taibaiella chishuiensis]|uniref:DNA 3'-5' helicase n=1 Tax=Taibaiella chishuiensis TaxID=1434707 RepID=A0A2P8DCV4_9BACT|nr:UvrD-helicase domain-containing protein [Taibaiella chishuiensis]PSK95050.1 DNA helicase-2/ATP-dependent DNA helicase PcrA [Taibaiella chishuiensis]